MTARRIAVWLLLAVFAASCRAAPEAQRSPNLPHVPVYPGAVLEEQVTGAGRDPTEYYRVRGATEEQVLAWYRSEMSAAGWSPSTDADETFVIYHTAEGCYGFVSAYTDVDGTVALQLSEQAADSPCQPYATGVAGDE